jgi:hypothetical protein
MEIMKVSAEINEIISKKVNRENQQNKIWFFEENQEN